MRSIFISAKHARVKQDLGICGLLNSGLLRDVEAVKELSDILVLHRGRLLDQSSGLGHSLDGVALKKTEGQYDNLTQMCNNCLCIQQWQVKVNLDNQLILLPLAVLNCDTGVHPHLMHKRYVSNTHFRQDVTQHNPPDVYLKCTHILYTPMLLVLSVLLARDLNFK